jgi:hypothetical protein
MLMALLLRWLVPLVLMLLQILNERLYRKRRVAWLACGRASSGPFRSGIAIDSTTWSFNLYSDHLLRGRLLANFMSPLLGFAVTSFCKVTRPFYLLIRSVGNAELFREMQATFASKPQKIPQLRQERYRHWCCCCPRAPFPVRHVGSELETRGARHDHAPRTVASLRHAEPAQI